jgi:hypothetical protein
MEVYSSLPGQCKQSYVEMSTSPLKPPFGQLGKEMYNSCIVVPNTVEKPMSATGSRLRYKAVTSTAAYGTSLIVHLSLPRRLDERMCDMVH